MLLPISVVHGQFVRDLFDMKRVQVIVQRKVMVKKIDQNPVPFKYLVWFCYDMKLERDLYFL
jgi:hypothetical protein